MMMGTVDGEQQVVSVPPGFRFHPTDEELLYYYLRKKVSYEAIDLDFIREVDLNKLEPWDLKEKCRIGSGGQNEWYFFSHKDKKYPTGSRTNRATRAGFWKATGRDKAIHHHHHLNNNDSWNKRIIIGMRKTLVFYTGRAPHGQKTDWIMHEYRLDDHPHPHPHITPTNYASSKTPVPEVQEDGWVVCKVFKKKNNLNRSQVVVVQRPEEEEAGEDDDDDHIHIHKQLMMGSVGAAAADQPAKQAEADAGVLLLPHNNYGYGYNNTISSMFDHHHGSICNYNMHLPQLLTPPTPPPPPHHHHHHHDNHDHQNITNSLMSSSDQDHNNPICGSTNSDWSFLDKLLNASHHHHSHQTRFNHLFLQHSSSATATPPPPPPPPPPPHDVFSFHHFGHQN